MDITTLPVWPAFLVSLVTLLGYCDYVFAGSMLNRPLVLAPLVGWILGDLHAGILMGASLELVFMGVVTIGSATPPDTVTGSVLGTALAIMTHQGVEIALTLALPISMLTQSLKIFIYTLRSSRMSKAMALAEQGNYRAMVRMHWGLFFLLAVPMMLVTWCTVMLGPNVVREAVGYIPQSIMQGIAAAAQILPAIGFALLLKLLWNKSIIAFFYLGFLLATLFHTSILGIALLGAIIALVMTQYGDGNNNKPGNDDDEVTIYE